MKPIPVALAAALAGLTLWRWGRLTWLVRAAAALACGALVVYGAGAVHLPGLDRLVATMGSTLGAYTYALVGVMAFLETGAFVGLLVPGETVVIVGGIVAGQGHVHVLILLGLTWACALGGTSPATCSVVAWAAKICSTTVRWCTSPSPASRGWRSSSPATACRRSWSDGSRGLVRRVVPFLAGASRYPPGRFTAAAVVGTGLWSTVCGRHRRAPDRGLDEHAPAARRGLEAPRRERSRVANAPELQAASEREGRRVSPRLRPHHRARAEDAA
jgi:hypothetical protein